MRSLKILLDEDFQMKVSRCLQHYFFGDNMTMKILKAYIQTTPQRYLRLGPLEWIFRDSDFLNIGNYRQTRLQNHIYYLSAIMAEPMAIYFFLKELKIKGIGIILREIQKA